MEKIVLHRRLPAAAPGRGSRRQRNAAHWSVARLPPPDHTAAYEAQLAVVKIVAVEVLDRLTHTSRAHELVDIDVLVEEQVDAVEQLVAEVAPNLALAGARIVGLTDAGRQHQ